MFKHLPKLAGAARAFARDCNYNTGCAKCLIQHGCPDGNTALLKQIGLLLLDAIASFNEPQSLPANPRESVSVDVEVLPPSKNRNRTQSVRKSKPATKPPRKTQLIDDDDGSNEILLDDSKKVRCLLYETLRERRAQPSLKIKSQS